MAEVDAGAPVSADNDVLLRRRFLVVICSLKGRRRFVVVVPPHIAIFLPDRQLTLTSSMLNFTD